MKGKGTLSKVAIFINYNGKTEENEKIYIYNKKSLTTYNQVEYAM